MPDWVEVGCYAGGRGDETPRVVLLGGRRLAGALAGDSSATLAEQHRKELGGQADQARVARDSHPKNGRWQRRAARWGRPATRPARA